MYLYVLYTLIYSYSYIYMFIILIYAYIFTYILVKQKKYILKYLACCILQIYINSDALS